MIGLSFRETMSGGYHLSSPDGGAASADRPMFFTVKVHLASLGSLLRTPLFEIEGAVFAEGLADHRPLRGTLNIDPVRAKVLVYMFRFEGNDGAQYEFQGRKTLGSGDLLHAMTVLPGTIHDASGKEVARALLRFDVRSDILKFLQSFRLERS